MTQFSRQELLEKVTRAIEDLQYNPQPANLYAPINYVLSLGGKRLRPILMLMAYNLYKEDVDSILQNAIGLEMYHNFTLLHDDLMDKAEMRRGKDCVHKKWNDNTAILSGDTMLILAYRLFTEHRTNDNSSVKLTINSETENRALRTFTEATLGVCEGQQYDMEFETRNDVTVDEYLNMIQLKTSVLLAGAVKIGAQLADADEADAQALYEYGLKMGLAFQLQDDLLDVYGDPNIFGKQIGGDILCNKKTFMLINALNLANPEQKAQLTSWINATSYVPESKIKAVTDLYNAIGIKKVAEEKIEAYFNESLNMLEKVKVDKCKKIHLKEFAHWLMGRKY